MNPALTPEEWAEIRTGDLPRVVWAGGPTDIELLTDGHGEYPNTYTITQSRRQAVAALCLHEQEFGFTRDMPQTLRTAAEKLRVLTDAPHWHWTDLNRMADRIEALLPPEEP